LVGSIEVFDLEALTFITSDSTEVSSDFFDCFAFLTFVSGSISSFDTDALGVFLAVFLGSDFDFLVIGLPWL
jgi:hypothetical protein